MHIIILGAGIIGVTSAYYLLKAGYQVTVIERNLHPALESSFANGSQLCYNCVNPIKPEPNSFNELRKFRNNLFLNARREFEQIINDNNIHFDHQFNGSLQIFYNETDFNKALGYCKFKKSLGIPLEILTSDQVIKSQSALAKNLIIAGIYFSNDGTGDCYQFTTNLAEICKKMGVRFLFDTEVIDLISDNKKITKIITSQGDYQADCYLAALGVYNKELFARIGIKLGITAKKGYSVTFDINDSENLPSIGIGDQKNNIYYSKLGSRFRITGVTQTKGINKEIEQDQIKYLIYHASKLFPDLDLHNKPYQPWAGLRPFPNDSIPIIGKTDHHNLFINSGHGGFGWTLAAISAKTTLEVITLYS